MFLCSPPLWLDTGAPLSMPSLPVKDNFTDLLAGLGPIGSPPANQPSVEPETTTEPDILKIPGMSVCLED